MNLPNKLSVARVLCIPAIVTLLHFTDSVCRYIAAALFIIGCLTDYLDGRTKQCAGNLPDGTAFMVSCPSGS